uniref:BZIP domain-containing protein n=1 Tax=Ascaris lumbricoides TaxID=6252 RepID=A0A0M3HSZ9_ASCLU
MLLPEYFFSSVIFPERKELLYLRNENRQLRTRLQKLNAERENHLRRISVICEGQRAAEAYMMKLINATQELLISYDGDNPAQATENTANSLPRRPARESDCRKLENDEKFH